METCEVTDSKGITTVIEKGYSVIVPVFAMNYDETHFPEPEKFHPERFDSEDSGLKKLKKNCMLMIFGQGPRICAGALLGQIMLKNAVAAILMQFEITLDEKTIEPYEMLPRHLLAVPKNPIYFKFNRL
jgi:cytochrome P450 family 6